MIQPLPNGTYEIAIQRRYQAADFSQFAGQLSFHCHLLVLMTTWRMGIKYKLFGDAGCVRPPPPLLNGRPAPLPPTLTPSARLLRAGGRVDVLGHSPREQPSELQL